MIYMSKRKKRRGISRQEVSLPPGHCVVNDTQGELTRQDLQRARRYICPLENDLRAGGCCGNSCCSIIATMVACDIWIGN